MAEANEYRIQSVVFGEEWLEVTFLETRHISKDVVTIQQQLIRPELYPDQIESILEDLGDLLDESFVHRRNPTMRSVPARERQGELEAGDAADSE